MILTKIHAEGTLRFVIREGLQPSIFGGVCIMVRLSVVASHWMDDSPSVLVAAPFLRDFGFEIGAKVVIEITQGVITIKALDTQDEL